MRVAWPDLVISIVLALGVFTGFRRGLIGELTGALAIGAGLVAAFAYSGSLDGSVARLTHVGPGSAHIVGLFAFSLIAYGIVLAFGLVLGNVAKLPVLNLINGIGGAAIGLVKSLLLVWVVVYVALFFPLSHDVREDLRKSVLVGLIASQNAGVDGRMRDGLPPFWRQFYDPILSLHHV